MFTGSYMYAKSYIISRVTDAVRAFNNTSNIINLVPFRFMTKRRMWELLMMMQKVLFCKI